MCILLLSQDIISGDIIWFNHVACGLGAFTNTFEQPFVNIEHIY